MNWLWAGPGRHWRRPDGDPPDPNDENARNCHSAPLASWPIWPGTTITAPIAVMAVETGPPISKRTAAARAPVGSDLGRNLAR